MFVIAAVGVGYAVCAVADFNPHLRSMMLAAVVCCLAAMVGAVPMVLSRGATQQSVAQAALVGTLLHLLGCTVLGGGAMLVRSLRLDAAYVYWLLGLYWLTLIVLAAGYVRAVKSAPIARQS